MKNKIFYLGFLLVTWFGWSQQYQTTITNYNYDVYMNDAGCNSVNNRVKITLLYSNGQSELIYETDAEQDLVTSLLLTHTDNRKPVKLAYYAYTKEKMGKNGCDGDWELIDDTILIPNGNCLYGSYYNPPDGGQAQIEVTFDYKITPVISIPQDPYNLRGYHDPITLSATPGFDSVVYNWQYQVSNSVPQTKGWIDMPIITNTQGKWDFSVIPSDFLSVNALNNKLYFRLKTCDNIYTNHVFYDLRQSAPHISAVTSTATSCFDVNDGTISIAFDRSLIIDESLSISLLNTDTNTSVSANNITVLNSGNTYDFDYLPKGNYTIDLIGFYSGINTYTGSPGHSSKAVIDHPAPVSFSITGQTNVWCYNGDDGEIQLQASGGSQNGFEFSIDKGANWNPFNNVTTHNITNLTSGNYSIMVHDANGCVAKEQILVNGTIKSGAKIIETITIGQPLSPLQIEMVDFSNPNAHGFTDGSIKARIHGGTISTGNTYNILWTNSAGKIQTDTQTEYINGQGYFVTLQNIGEGTYTLEATDTNYSDAINKTSCLDAEYQILTHPDPLSLSIEETHEISCNSSHTNNDPFSDGELRAIALGGVQLDASHPDFYTNNQLPYFYLWKRKDVHGNWMVLPDETADVLSNIEAGEYAVNIEDANGIVVGNYTSNKLTKTTDITYILKEPEPLQITLNKQDVYCYSGNDGRIKATITGGTPDYTILWNNQANTNEITNLTAGTYTVIVTDDKGCRASESIEILEPTTPISVTITNFRDPTASGATNGNIEATINGGTAFTDGSYHISWMDENGNNLNSKSTTTLLPTGYVISLNDVGKGIYSLQIEDAHYQQATSKNNCTHTSTSFTLYEPDPLKAEIKEYKPISCNQLNKYGNPDSDGSLEVQVTGGVRFKSGAPYKYTWKKKINGVWQELSDQKNKIATNLNAGSYAVNIEDANGIILGIYQDNKLVSPVDVIFDLTEPELLKVSLTKQDVYCFQGDDGWAKATVSGGTAPYTILWSHGEKTSEISALTAGDYVVHIIDSRGCEVSESLKIIAPTTPISITYTNYSRPTHIGATDAWIEAEIHGGTLFDDGTYQLNWQDHLGNNLNSNIEIISTGISDGIYKVTLKNINAGSYYLSVTDKNFSTATAKEGCTFSDSEFVLYEPIEAIIEEYVPISCNGMNEFLDPFSDGQLIAQVKGGLPFSGDIPYIYHWKRKNDQGIWEIMPNQTKNIAIGLKSGDYALNIEDSLGHIIGIYQGGTVIKETDITFSLSEPDLLELALSTSPISCDSGADGSAKVSISGGVAPYDIEWSNGENSPSINGLISGSYFVWVTDGRGCQATGNIKIDQPGGLDIAIIHKTNPTCYQGNDGEIALKISGGHPPYSYQWNTGKTSEMIDKLTEGIYTFTLTDSQNCTAFIQIELENPNPVLVDLGADRTLCNDQFHDLDISIDDPDAQYLWTSTNGFTSNSPIVSLTEAGKYTATITSLEGCSGTDEILISQNSTAIDSEFFIASQAFVGEDIVLVNVSNPISKKVEWLLPQNTKIISQSNETIILQFEKSGAYDITLRSFQNACYQDFTKKIIVDKARDIPEIGDTETPFIIGFKVFPNPSNGQFTVAVDLAEKAQIALRLINYISYDVAHEHIENGRVSNAIPYSLNLASGTYILLLETPGGSQIQKIVIK